MFESSSNVNKGSTNVNKLIITHFNIVKQFVPQVIKLWNKIFTADFRHKDTSGIVLQNWTCLIIIKQYVTCVSKVRETLAKRGCKNE